MPRAESADELHGPAIPGAQIPGRIPQFLSRLVPDQTRPG